MKMCTVLIRDQTAHSVHSDLDLHCPQKLPVLSSVRKDLKNIKMAIYLFFSIILHFTLHNKKKKKPEFSLLSAKYLLKSLLEIVEMLFFCPFSKNTVYFVFAQFSLIKIVLCTCFQITRV